MKRNLSPLSGLVFLLMTALGFSTSNAQEESSLPSQVEKILVAHCFECHSGDSAESGFRLDVERARVLRGGESGDAAIVAGSPEKSQLFHWITNLDAAERMPPDTDPLSKAEIDTIRKWIQNGAEIPAKFQASQRGLWSFQPITRPVLSPGFLAEIQDSRNENAIDLFVHKKLSATGLQFSEPAARATLIRRIYLVMLGVPPSPEEVSRFVEDDRSDAYERLVNHVLSSAGFGERWAQHWMDIVRFGETHGFETNRERPNAWFYRDYLVESLNSDKPYDRFVKEQIAGDQLSADVATGFIVAGPHDIVKSPDINLTLMQRQDELADIVNVTGTTFLGLTVGCARCHNHKFDPISQKDFYSMQAIFAGINHSDRRLPAAPDVNQRLAEIDREIANYTKQLEKFVRVQADSMILIDDGQIQGPSRIEYVVKPAGKGVNPKGSLRGFADDRGSSTRSMNISGGQYTWWENQPGKDLAVYHPNLSGRTRIWLSWGAGIRTHSPDAVYQLDKDGDLKTKGDRVDLAKVDQRRFSDGSGEIGTNALWSGFRNSGIHQLDRHSKIVVVGGKTGSAVTTDVILLEPIANADEATNPDAPLKPSIRGPVTATGNVDQFPPVKARFVRFTIEQTNVSEPCIDELEIFSKSEKGEQNVALASSGAKASSAGDYQHPLHKLSHINDGKYGNSKSWIAAQRTGGWVQIELPEERTIHRVRWARDREGRFSDRVATRYRIEVATEKNRWRLVSSSADRMPLGESTPRNLAYDFAKFSTTEAAAGERLLSQLEFLKQQRAKLAKPVAVYAGTFSQPPPTHRLYRGDPLQKREIVEPNTVTKLGTLELDVNAVEGQRRLAFADWLVRKDNPLVARVIVNRLWQHTFGQGIVATPNDFGNMGRTPSHPLLLDWLASELIASGWSLKHVQRLILTSRTFQQSSRPDAIGLAKDAGNELLWRFAPRRLAAETIRDSILEVSGVLNHRLGGKGFDGFEVQLENVRHFFPKSDYGPGDWRRMIYMTKVRQEKDSVFGAFDCPDASQIIDRRSRSITPLQALNLFNSRFVLQQAGILAERISGGSLKSAEKIDVEKQVSQAYQLLYSRQPEAKELKEALGFIEEFGQMAFCRALLNSNEFLFIQ